MKQNTREVDQAANAAYWEESAMYWRREYYDLLKQMHSVIGHRDPEALDDSEAAKVKGEQSLQLPFER